MKIMTLHIWVRDEDAERAFNDLVDATKDDVISVDRDNMTIAVKPPTRV